MVLICIFLVRDVKHLSRYLLALCTSSLEKYVFFKSDFSLSLMLSCLSHLRNLDVNLLSDISFPSIFPYSISGLFILLLVPFSVQYFLVGCSLTCLLFFSCLKRQIQKILRLMSNSILPMFSSISFMGLGITFNLSSILSLCLDMV